MNDLSSSHSKSRFYSQTPRAFITRNAARGNAFSQESRGALAMLALTFSGRDTFYRPADSITQQIVKLADAVPAAWLGKLALYCRQHAGLRESPALLCAILARRDGDVFRQVAPVTLDDPTMLRRFVYHLKSGVTGRPTMGSRAKRFLKTALENTADPDLVRHSAGNNPSLTDLICLSHPRPDNREREALYAWLIGRPCNVERLPEIVQELEEFRADITRPVPRLPVELLTSLPLSEREWCEIARHADWQETRRYLNTFTRNGVFKHDDLTERVAARLADPEEIRWAAPSVQQLFSALAWADHLMPQAITDALTSALEQTLQVVPAIAGRICVAIDVSGSMHCPCTGFRSGCGSLFRTIDLASLIAAGLLRKNRDGLLLTFDETARETRFPREKSLMDQVTHLTDLGTGGTACGSPIRYLLNENEDADLVVLISDNQTWAEPQNPAGTELQVLWKKYLQRNPHARLVCLDLQPEESLPIPDQPGVLNLAGFTGETYHLIDEFSRGTLNATDLPGFIENLYPNP